MIRSVEKTKDYWICPICGANLDLTERECSDCEGREHRIEIFDWVKNVVSNEVGRVRALYTIPDGENAGSYIDLDIGGEIKYDSPLRNYKLVRKGETCNG